MSEYPRSKSIFPITGDTSTFDPLRTTMTTTEYRKHADDDIEKIRVKEDPSDLSSLSSESPIPPVNGSSQWNQARGDQNPTMRRSYSPRDDNAGLRNFTSTYGFHSGISYSSKNSNIIHRSNSPTERVYGYNGCTGDGKVLKTDQPTERKTSSINREMDRSSSSLSEQQERINWGTANKGRSKRVVTMRKSPKNRFNHKEKRAIFRNIRGIHGSSSDKELSESCEEDSLIVTSATRPAPLTWNMDGRDYRRKLDDELAQYKQKLASYQEGQQRQSNLVQRLQTKVLQYKEKCRTLELKLQLAEAENQNRKAGLDENTAEYEATLCRLEEEQQRASTLASVNTMLREQLDQTTQANQSLASENQRFRDEATRFRELLERREAEWRNEETAFNDYFTMEHGRLLTLWRAVVGCRRQFVEVKGQVEREISAARADVARMSRVCQSACENFASNLRSTEVKSQANLEWERTEKKKLERQLEELTQANELIRQQLECDLRSTNQRLVDSNTQLDEIKRRLADRERTINSLQRLRTGQSLCGRREGSDIEDPASRALVEEVQAMQQALRELAQATIHSDLPSADSCEGPSECYHRSRSRSPCYASSPSQVRLGNGTSRAGAYGRTGSPPPPLNSTNACYWADSTLGAVQAAFHKRGLQVSDLSNKLISLQDQCETTKRQLDDSETERRNLEHQLIRMRSELDTSRREREEATRDADRYKSTLQTITGEKSDLEKTRVSLTEQVKSLQGELERVQAGCAELQRIRERLEEDLMQANRDAERSMRETERCQRCIEGLEERLSAAREESTGLREALQCARLEAEIKATERADLQEALSKCETRRAELEAETVKARNEETALNERLTKQQTRIDDLCTKRQALQAQIRNLESEYNHLGLEYRSMEADKAALREALLQMETQKNEIASEKSTLAQSLTVSEAARERLEDELSRFNKEKIELAEQLNAVTRQKNALTNELAQKTRDAERLRESITRLTAEKEDLTKEKGDLVSKVRELEREVVQLSDMLAVTRKEHQNLEADYYQAKQQIAQLETHRDLLENENQELSIKRENLMGEYKRAKADWQQELERITQSRDQATQQAERREQELQQALQAAKEAAEQEVTAVRHQLVETRRVADNELHELTKSHKLELAELIAQIEKEKEAHQNEVMTFQRERDETALAIEAERQAMLSAAEQDRGVLNDRLTQAQQQIKALDTELERVKREAQARHERDDTLKSELTQELKDFRKHYEETCSFHEESSKDLQNKIAEVVAQRDGVIKEVEELQVQLKLLDESRDGVQRTLVETTRRLRDTDEARETLRKEIIDLRRVVSEMQRERDMYAESKDNLTKRVRDLETEKVEQARLLAEEKQTVAGLEEQKCTDRKEIGELRSCLRESEKARLDTRRDLQELRRQLKDANAERERQAKDIMELQSRLGREEEKNEALRQEQFTLKQRISELETARTTLKKNLASAERRIADLQESLASHEREFKQAMEHASCEHRRLTEARNQLQTGLEAVNTDLSDMRAALSGSESRVNTLESQLGRSEELRRDLERKLASIHSSLRRLIGYRQPYRRSEAGMCCRRSTSRSPIRPALNCASPPGSRNCSPEKDLSADQTRDGRRGAGDGRGDGTVYGADLDPESVRHALHDFVQRFCSVRRDMEDAQAQVNSLQSRLDEQAEQTEQWARRLHQVQQALCEAEADKKGVDGRLTSTQTALMLQEETLRKNERDRKQMADKISLLERQLAASECEKREEQERMLKIRQSEARLEEEQRLSRRALEEAENRITQLEVVRRSLEGELQRIKMSLNDKEAENQMLQDRSNNLCKQIQDLESKSQSLQLTVDRLSLALTKSEELESVSKDKMQQMTMTLSDHNQTIQDLQQRLCHLQKALATSEQDRRIAQERLDNTRSLLQEHKHQNQQMSERLQSLQAELTECDIRRGELESQNRQITGVLSRRQENEQDLSKQLQTALRERQELQERVASLQRSLCETEAARDQLMQASNNLEKDRHCLRRHLEKVEKEKIQHEEILNKGNLDRTELELTLRRLEEENADQKRQVHFLQSRLNELEQMHAQRLAEVASRQRAETELEMERLRHNQQQAERALEARERAHRQRVKVLEDQLIQLKIKMAAIRDQLTSETRKRQQLLGGKTATPTVPKLSDKPSCHIAREARRLLDNPDVSVKPYLSTGDLRRTTCCSGPEKKSNLDRNRSGSRGTQLGRK